MQLSLRPALPPLFHPGAANAIAAWRGTAGHAPLRLLRNDRVGPGRRTRGLLAAGTLAAGILGSAGLAAALLPAGAPPILADAEPLAVAVHGASEAEVALALQAAGAFAGPLPGRERPALRFGTSPDLPLPEPIPAEGSASAPSPEPTPAARVGPIDAIRPAAIEAGAASPGAVEPAAEPVRTASIPGRPPMASAPQKAGAAAHPRASAAPAARPQRVALARKAESPATRPQSDAAPSWTLPGALAPTTP